MKSTLIAIGSGILLGLAFFFTISKANAGRCISEWNVTMELESIEVGGQHVDEYQINNVPWPNNGRTEVWADAGANEFNSKGQIDNPMCFEYGRDENE